ncbi:MAG TPA: GGDEF domain-containing protein [Spongiibacteraceae bacterium]|jgi:diguanylate cyclase
MTADSRDNGKRKAEEHDHLVRLLCRALSRLAVAAQGIDRRLDDMLGELRQLLRRDIDDPQQLSLLVDAIDARIKDVDDERDQRGDLLQSSLQRMIEQLLAYKPSASVARELKNLQKDFKQKLADGEEFKLFARLPALQAQVLDGAGTARGGLFSRLFGRDETARKSTVQIDVDDADIKDRDIDGTIARNASEAIRQNAEPISSTPVLETSTVATSTAAVETAAPEATSIAESEPPFARISIAVCQVLDHLLMQIDPPPSATDNYRHAREQIAKGLNWYELVSTLEEVGIIVLAALERGQGEFQEFLLGISKRLEEAHHVLGASRQNQEQRRHADETLNVAVRSEVQQMQVQVAEATHMDFLKSAIGARLDTIVGALDHHRVSEQQRQRELEQQLNTLTERMREMEVQSLAIEKRMLEQQRLALLDPLTQLPNRQAYEQRMHEEYDRWKRYARPLTLAVCDLDNFKSINDNFGHLAGDKVLRIIAKTLRARLRKSDFIARFGGEEFVILLPETDREEAFRAIETIREAVAECPFHFREQPVAVTLSAGIAAFVDDASPEAVFERADAAMYQAKEAGRNRCIIAPH